MRSYHHSEFEPARAVSVCIPVRNEAATIGGIVEAIAARVDQVVVVDAASSDGSARIAADAGAEVYDQSDLLPHFGEARGKGDAMWRSLSVLRNEVVCFVDGDSLDFGPHFVHGIVGPLISDPAVSYVKGHYRRPFDGQPEGGGRVTELTARPLLRLFYPELAACRQPLAGEIAARKPLLESIPWVTGYGVEIAQLIDVYREVGIAGMAQVDLDVRQNQHQPLSALGEMATDVAAALAVRLAREGRLVEAPAMVERPPLRSQRVRFATPANA